MKVSKEQVAAQGKRILAIAARLFRQRGFDDVTVADVMRDAGLTHGAFYGYFPSKQALITAAVGQALPLVPDTVQPSRSAGEFADDYLSVKHRDNLANACLFSSLGTEAARGTADLRNLMTEAVRRRVITSFSAGAAGGTPDEKRRAAIVSWSAMVGAMVLARLVDDDSLVKRNPEGDSRCSAAQVRACRAEQRDVRDRENWRSGSASNACPAAIVAPKMPSSG